MEAKLFWIPGPWRGRLAIVARPRGGDWLGDEAAAWRRAGVDVAVSLLEEQEAAQLGLAGEQDAAREQAITFVSFPIPDLGVPFSLMETVSFLCQLAAELEAGRNVAVHCRQGIGRSGLVASAALVTAGASPEEAMKAVSAARGLTVPETPDQRRWMERLPSVLPVTKL